MKLKHSEIRAYREAQLLDQDHKCALCGEHLDLEEAVLDHDHKTGLIRKVLHRGCNSLEGKIVNAMPRSKINLTRLEGIAHNLISYLTTTHTDLVHPTYKTSEEKKMKKKKKGGGRGRGR